MNFRINNKMGDNKKQILYLVIIIGFISGWIATSGKKSQFIRLLDIFIIGPVMIYFSLLDTMKEKIYILKCVLGYFGATTITYNLKNFIKFHSISK